MKTNLVPIRFTFGRGTDGRAAYPKFNKVPGEIRNGLGWSKYVDVYGSGMVYDKVDNLGTGHDFGTAYILVPEDFANAAAQELDEVEIVDEATFEVFWDERSRVVQDEEEIDTEYLQGLLAQIQLEKELEITPSVEKTNERKKALDPNDKSRGVRKNKQRYWKDAKNELKLEIHPRYRKGN